MSRFAAAVIVLTAIYALGLASLAPLDLAIGAALAAAILLVPRPGRRPWERAPSFARRLAALPVFAALTAWDVLLGAWDVTLTILGVRPLRRSGIVAIPIGERTTAGIAVTAFTMTLSPGEVLVDVDRERDAILVQVLDATDPEGVRERQARRYEVQRKVVP